MSGVHSNGTFGALLRRLRLAAGLTQGALSDRTGVSTRALQELESGITRPRRETIRRLIAVLDLEPEVRAQFEAATSAPRRRATPPDGDDGLSKPADRAGANSTAGAIRQRAITTQRQIPTPLTSFIGRERELTELAPLLASRRLLTLTGPGGCGKTRLALELTARSAGSFPGGVSAVSLASVSDADMVAAAIARAFGVQESAHAPLETVLAHFIGTKRLLLLLDNFEHLVTAAPLIADLLATCPGLSVLATSRERLRLQGEQVYAVRPLALPDHANLPHDAASLLDMVVQSEAVQLFANRAKSVQPDFRLDPSNARTVADICARLDGLPLAIELAAARVRLLEPALLHARLEHGLKMLTGGARDLPLRQQTLQATIAWSHDLLVEPEQRLFRRLGVFAGAFTSGAVAQVCDIEDGSESAAFEQLGSLVEKSLLDSVASLGGEPRFTMLETVRQYSLDKLEAAGELPDLRRRHLGWYVDLAERGQSGVFGPDGAAWLDRLAAELDNLRAAMAWSLTDARRPSALAGLRTAVALQQLWLYRDGMVEGLRWLERTLASVRAHQAETVRDADGSESTGEILAPARRVTRTGAFGTEPEVFALNCLAVLYLNHGQREHSTRAAIEGLDLARRLGDRLGEAHALICLGNVGRIPGAYERSAELLEESLTIVQELGDRVGAWRALLNLGTTYGEIGDVAREREALEASLSIAEGEGYGWGASQVRLVLGVSAYRQGDLARAAEMLETCLDGWSRMGATRGRQAALRYLALILVRTGDVQRAAAYCVESITISHDAGDAIGIVRGLEVLATVASGRTSEESDAHVALAAELLGATSAAREALRIPFSADDRSTRTRGEAAALERLGDAAYAVAWSHGQTTSLDEAMPAAFQLAHMIRSSDATG